LAPVPPRLPSSRRDTLQGSLGGISPSRDDLMSRPTNRSMAVHARRRRQKRKRKRSVYIIARPLKAAGPLSVCSDGKFPVCHWGLLVTSRSREEVIVQWRKYCETTDPSHLPPWGTMIELSRLPDNTNVYNVSTDFGLHEWYKMWGPSISIWYVGETGASDSHLADRGIA
jgi:hypothetical protein